MPISTARRRASAAAITAAAMLAGVLALAVAPADVASAAPDCDVPNPPPVCLGGPETTRKPTTTRNPNPPPPPPPADIYRPASDWYSDSFIPVGAQPIAYAFNWAGPVDAMVPVPAATQRQYPYSAVVSVGLHDAAGNNGVGCTGFLMGPHSVGLSAHCVYQKGLSYRGRGTVRGTNGRQCNIIGALTPPEWREDPGGTSQSREQTKWDYAGLTIDCDLGYEVGWLSMAQGDHSIDGADVSRPCIDAAGFPGYQMASGDVSYTSTAYDHLKMYFQGNHGCSGAPVWQPGVHSRVIAIHSTGSDDDFGGAVGAAAIRATRIDWRVGTDLMGYINQCQGGWSWPDGCDLHVD